MLQRGAGFLMRLAPPGGHSRHTYEQADSAPSGVPIAPHTPPPARAQREWRAGVDFAPIPGQEPCVMLLWLSAEAHHPKDPQVIWGRGWGWPMPSTLKPERKRGGGEATFPPRCR